MTDRPIIFSAPMVRALLDGRKTQTRRVLKPPYGTLEYLGGGDWRPICTNFFKGDRLYVRETVVRQETDQGVGYQTYAADGAEVWPLTQWHHKRNAIPSIHMPRWASRITLTVTDVRVQRLQDISRADCIAEGISAVDPAFPSSATTLTRFQGLWNSLHGPDAWTANHWVVAVSFTVQRGNIDQIGGAV